MSERQRSARTRGSHAELTNLVCPLRIVQLAFCDYATNEVDRDASTLFLMRAILLTFF
jgi:hypothetical protein